MVQEPKQAPVRVHLEELRKRLLWVSIAVAVATGLAFAFHQQILQALLAPAQGFANTPGGRPVFTEITEMVGIIMKVSILTGLILALPVILYQIIMFIAPGLTRRERRYLLTFLPGTLLAFAAGVAFGYFILFPPALKFLLSFGSDIATPFIRIGNYVNLIVMLLFWMGLIFEMPLVLFLLAKLGVVSSRRLARSRRYAVLVAFILGAVITPTFDPINQGLVALPIMALYEVGIWLAKLAERTRRQAAAAVAETQNTV